MPIRDRNIKPTSNVAKKTLVIGPITTAVSQTGLVIYKFTPGFTFQILTVSTFCTAVTATLTVDVTIAGTSCLTAQVTPVAATETLGVLSGTLTALRGLSTEDIEVNYTTGGSGVATNLMVTIYYRHYPMFGEGFAI